MTQCESVSPISCPAGLQLSKNPLWFFHPNRGPLFQVTLGNFSPFSIPWQDTVQKWGPGGYVLAEIEIAALNFGHISMQGTL